MSTPISARTSAHARLARVSFANCQADGSAGPFAAPKTKMNVRTEAKAAVRLAYYKSEHGPGILAPRGWHCVEIYGSGGSALFVVPELAGANDLDSANWKGFTGPAIEVDAITGETSGRFIVATIAARVFPTARAFVQKVIDEKIEPASDFPFGPYAGDKLTYRSDRMVEYRTLPNSVGLGTTRRLQKNGDPIDGAAILVGQPQPTGLLFLTMRLPHGSGALESPIIQQFEKEWRSKLIGR